MEGREEDLWQKEKNGINDPSPGFQEGLPNVKAFSANDDPQDVT